MNIPSTQFSLEGSDGGLSAYDLIVNHLEEQIEEGLQWAEKENGTNLGFVYAHLHALATLGEGTGGYATTNLDVDDLERRTLAAFRKHIANYPDTPEEQVDNETAFIKSLVGRLRALIENLESL